ncbi:MAG TPA: oligosaccharide flippase family protein [Anaerolineales bacterium]
MDQDPEGAGTSPDASGPVKAAPPLAQRVARGGFLVAISSYFNIIFGFLANTLILTRLLPPTDFGIFALALSIFSFGNLRPKMGVGYALAHHKETTGELIGTHMTLDISAGFATLLLAGFSIPVLLHFGYSWDVVYVILALGVGGILDAITSTAWVLLDRELNFGRPSIVQSFVFPLSYLPAFYLALHQGGYWSLVAQNVTYALLQAIGIWWAARRRLEQNVWQMHWTFDPRLAKELLRFGVVAGMSTLAGVLVAQFDNFLVGTLRGDANLGFYSRAYNMAQWPSVLVTSVITQASFYTYTRLRDDPVRLKKTVTMVLWIVTSLALPLALAIFASAPDLVSLLWTPKWLPSAPFVRFLVSISIIRPLIDNAGLLFVAVGKPRRTTMIAFIQAGVLILFATPLTMRYGVPGTCVGVGIAFGAGLVLNYYYLLKTVPLDLKEVFLSPGLATLVAMGAYFLLAKGVNLNLLPQFGRVALKSGFVVAVFYLILLALQPRLLIERLAYVARLVWVRA